MNYNLSALGVPSGAWAQSSEVTFELIKSEGIETVKQLVLGRFSRSTPSGYTSSLIIIDPREEPATRPEEIGYRDSVVSDLHQRSTVLIIAYSSLKLTR